MWLHPFGNVVIVTVMRWFGAGFLILAVAGCPSSGGGDGTTGGGTDTDIDPSGGPSGVFPTIAIECGENIAASGRDGLVKVRMGNLPSYAKQIFQTPEGDPVNFVINATSEDGGSVEWVAPGRYTSSGEDGYLWFAVQLTIGGQLELSEQCQRLDGSLTGMSECERVCCLSGVPANEDLMSRAACTAAAGEVVPVAQCQTSQQLCCKDGGLFGPGPLVVRGGSCGANSTVVEARWCGCCWVDGQVEQAGHCGSGFFPSITEFGTPAMTATNCCYSDLDGSSSRNDDLEVCSAETATDPCAGTDSCTQRCCADENGQHTYRESDLCPAENRVDGTCSVQRGCCMVDDQAWPLETDTIYEGEGAATYDFGSPGSVTFALKQLSGAVMLFEEEFPGSSRCTIEVPGTGVDSTGSADTTGGGDPFRFVDPVMDNWLQANEVLVGDGTATTSAVADNGNPGPHRAVEHMIPVVPVGGEQARSVQADYTHVMLLEPADATDISGGGQILFNLDVRRDLNYEPDGQGTPSGERLWVIFAQDGTTVRNEVPAFTADETWRTVGTSLVVGTADLPDLDPAAPPIAVGFSLETFVENQSGGFTASYDVDNFTLEWIPE